MAESLRLHGYWRSTASYRVRIALNFKGLGYTQVCYDLRQRQHQSEAYRRLAPQGLVPTLEDLGSGSALAQSPAILEWLEERWPQPPLLPSVAADRAVVRAMAALVGCDIHPLNNLRVLQALRQDFAPSEAQVSAWIARWIGEGFTALNEMIARYGDGYAFGSTPTLADCYLVPQLYSARRFAVDLAPYPQLIAAAEQASRLPAFVRAEPERQPDAD